MSIELIMDFIEIILTWIQLLNMNLEIINAIYLVICGLPIAIIDQLHNFTDQV